MKLFVVLSVVLMSALVASNPVAVQEAQTREGIVLSSGSFNGWFSGNYRYGIDDDFVITAFTITRTAGEATWELLDGGVGFNFVSIRVIQPLTIPRYQFDYQILGQPQDSTFISGSDLLDQSDVKVN